jgi:ABC-type multidrug transport system fused ATPase/permease subunit
MKNSRKQMSEINSTLENSVGGIRETKAYAAEEFERCKFRNINSLFERYRGDAMKSLGSFDSIMTFLQDILYLTIVLIGSLFLYNGKLTAAEFTAFLLYISMFLNPIQRFVSLFQQLQEGMSGFSRFCEIMEAEEEIDRERYALLLALADPRLSAINKRRYVFFIDSQCYEVDIYPFWKSTAILETELDDENKIAKTPSFLHVIKEVTGEKRYSNHSLAAFAPPDPTL